MSDTLCLILFSLIELGICNVEIKKEGEGTGNETITKIKISDLMISVRQVSTSTDI